MAKMKRQQVEPLALALQNVGDEDVKAAIVHLRGKAVLVRARWREAWTRKDVQAVETLIWFCLTRVRDVADVSGQGGGM